MSIHTFVYTRNCIIGIFLHKDRHIGREGERESTSGKNEMSSASMEFGNFPVTQDKVRVLGSFTPKINWKLLRFEVDCGCHFSDYTTIHHDASIEDCVHARQALSSSTRSFWKSLMSKPNECAR